MSRYYDFEADIKPCADTDEQNTVSDILIQERFQPEDELTYEGVYSITGTVTLYAGETEAEAHERLYAAIGDEYKLATRWRCLEDLPWDTVIEPDDWKDAEDV